MLQKSLTVVWSIVFVAAVLFFATQRQRQIAYDTDIWCAEFRTNPSAVVSAAPALGTCAYRSARYHAALGASGASGAPAAVNAVELDFPNGHAISVDVIGDSHLARSPDGDQVVVQWFGGRVAAIAVDGAVDTTANYPDTVTAMLGAVVVIAGILAAASLVWFVSTRRPPKHVALQDPRRSAWRVAGGVTLTVVGLVVCVAAHRGSENARAIADGFAADQTCIGFGRAAAGASAAGQDGACHYVRAYFGAAGSRSIYLYFSNGDGQLVNLIDENTELAASVPTGTPVLVQVFRDEPVALAGGDVVVTAAGHPDVRAKLFTALFYLSITLPILGIVRTIAAARQDSSSRRVYRVGV